MNTKLIHCRWVWYNGTVSDDSFVTRLPLTGALKRLHEYRDAVIKAEQRIHSFHVLTISDCGATKVTLLTKLGAKLIESIVLEEPKCTHNAATNPEPDLSTSL